MPDEQSMYVSAALNQALDEILRENDDVVLMGEDIGVYGGAFGITRGLWDTYGPERIWETPISENSVVGAAVGAAAMGLRPIVEIMFMDFLALALDQILNSAGKLHYMYNAQVNIPLVLRAPAGAKGGYGPSHSQMLSGMLIGIPGIKVVAPSDAESAKALLKAAVQDPNPVVFIENKRLYSNRGLVPQPEVPMDMHRCRVRGRGGQVSLIAYSAMVPAVEEVRAALQKRGVESEGVDLVSLKPLDREGITASVRRTGRAVVIEEACLTGGVGAEVAAIIGEDCMDCLEAPVKRVAAADTPIPSSPELEKYVLPDIRDIAQAVQEILQW